MTKCLEADLDRISEHNISPVGTNFFEDEPIIGERQDFCLRNVGTSKLGIGTPWVNNDANLWLINARDIRKTALIRATPDRRFASNMVGLRKKARLQSQGCNGDPAHSKIKSSTNEIFGEFRPRRLDPRDVNTKRVCDLLTQFDIDAKGLLQSAVGKWRVI
jgi:hypothetical protein